MSAKIEAMIKAVRNDSLVGRGSCSWIDEACSDEELAERLDDAGITSARAAVAWARRQHKMYEDVAADVRSTAW